MLKKTYLQWPDSECANPAEAQGLFWSQLRRAIGTSSRMGTEENCTGVRDSEVPEQSENAKNDEKSFLLP